MKVIRKQLKANSGQDLAALLKAFPQAKVVPGVDCYTLEVDLHTTDDGTYLRSVAPEFPYREAKPTTLDSPGFTCSQCRKVGLVLGPGVGQHQGFHCFHCGDVFCVTCAAAHFQRIDELQAAAAEAMECMTEMLKGHTTDARHWDALKELGKCLQQFQAGVDHLADLVAAADRLTQVVGDGSTVELASVDGRCMDNVMEAHQALVEALKHFTPAS